MRNSRAVATTVVAAVALAFALSVAFWLIYDVFNLAGFIIWSLVSGIAGGLLGELLMRNLIGGLLLAAVIRIAVFILLSGLFF